MLVSTCMGVDSSCGDVTNRYAILATFFRGLAERFRWFVGERCERVFRKITHKIVRYPLDIGCWCVILKPVNAAMAARPKGTVAMGTNAWETAKSGLIVSLEKWAWEQTEETVVEDLSTQIESLVEGSDYRDSSVQGVGYTEYYTNSRFGNFAVSTRDFNNFTVELECFTPSDAKWMIQSGEIPSEATGVRTVERNWVDCISYFTAPENFQEFTSERVLPEWDLSETGYQWVFDGVCDCGHECVTL